MALEGSIFIVSPTKQKKKEVLFKLPILLI